MWRKVKRKFRNISKTQTMIGACLLCILFITVGYAVMSQVLKINGYATIDAGDGMIFTSIETSSNNGASIESAPKIKAKTMVNTTVSFATPGTVTFNVSTKNQGEYDAKLIDIEKLERINNVEPSCITISVLNHEIKDLVYPQDTKDFQIKVTSTCTTLSSKEIEIYFKYDKQETQGGVIPTISDKITELLKTKPTYNYMDGTYLKGYQDSNYAWFNGFMWRIMGINKDGSVRMITEEDVTAIRWGPDLSGAQYDTSYVNDWLNNYFYPKLKNKDFLVDTIWCSEVATAMGDSSRTTCTNNLSKETKPVGLISLDEYNLANGESSYLDTAQQFLTLTPSGERVFSVNQLGNPLTLMTKIDGGVRPVISISSDIMSTGGSGTLIDPYMIEDKTNDTTGALKDHSYVGEYVTYAGRNYRVVETSDRGTKLILDGYYDANNDGIISETDDYSKYKESVSGECSLCIKINEESFLDWLTNNNSNDALKLSSTTWYQGAYWTGGDYKTNLLSTENPYTGKVGLIRVGEMLSGQSETILSKNHTVENASGNNHAYWTGTLYHGYNTWSIGKDVIPSNYHVLNTRGIRPVIMISPDIIITGGNGTPNHPYQI